MPPAPLECAAGRAQLSQGKAVTWGNAWAGCHLCVPKPAGHSADPLVAFSQRSLSHFPQFPSFLCHCTQPLVSSACPERVPLSFPALPTSLPPSEDVLLPFSLRALLWPGPGWLLGATPCPHRPQLHRLLGTTEEISAAQTHFLSCPGNSHSWDQSERLAVGLRR